MQLISFFFLFFPPFFFLIPGLGECFLNRSRDTSQGVRCWPSKDHPILCHWQTPEEFSGRLSKTFKQHHVKLHNCFVRVILTPKFQPNIQDGFTNNKWYFLLSPNKMIPKYILLCQHTIVALTTYKNGHGKEHR